MEPKFKICIAMAGAVSAGAYTAGAMDYLLETLELWEKAKEKNRRLGPEHPEYNFSIPMHDVAIDVMSGASAGGINGSLALLNLADGSHTYVNKDNPFGKNNRFYQSWVEMGDDAEGSTFEKLLSLTDLKKGEKPDSLLNTKPIDGIAEKALVLEKLHQCPPYISPSLDLVLTTTNLQGINFKIDFGGSNNSGTVITSHAGFFRYRLANETTPSGVPADENSLFFILNLSDPKHMGYLKDATLSTAAFPIGLKSRKVAISQKYVDRYPKYLFGQRRGITPILEENAVYQFSSIDGGLINNEPFGIALKVLREKNAPEVAKDQYAVIMIDPFPNHDNAVEGEDIKTDMVSVAKGMFRALRNQVMFNQDGLLEALELNDRTKFLIAPVRKELRNGELIRAKNDLASAPFSGFAGFMDKSFRHHDYYLGRQNCQAFLRYYFAVTQDSAVQRLGIAPHPEAINRYGFFEAQGDALSRKLFPIIPDMRLLHTQSNKADSDTYGIDATLAFPAYPSLDAAAFRRKYKGMVKNRIETVLNRLFENFWASLINKLVLQHKVYHIIEEALFKELEDAGLLKK
ncbi:hypothetical protein CHU92_08530 [Flavobacterium cyanobacteriorum]|uniref:PNPLA domain-containing protein n=1 Tax=Flavobacterium cyanobacteriorum TaxID=2022802 RepID=A0A255Z6X7_9FLAO|nr:patatin-like phospholipase family protein [Flavobacterium cyanobacteriorum]OYQ37228.1 hypothetical protein CHU92_08530 [Flavobacterium cyanobacteriorum]